MLNKYISPRIQK